MLKDLITDADYDIINIATEPLPPPSSPSLLRSQSAVYSLPGTPVVLGGGGGDSCTGQLSLAQGWLQRPQAWARPPSLCRAGTPCAGLAGAVCHQICEGEGLDHDPRRQHSEHMSSRKVLCPRNDPCPAGLLDPPSLQTAGTLCGPCIGTARDQICEREGLDHDP